MNNTHLSPPKNRRLVLETSLVALAAYLAIAAFVWIVGCNKDAPTNTLINDRLSQDQFETTGEEFLINALAEVENIADYAQRSGNSNLPSKSHKAIISSTASDTSYVYGEVTADGYGAVVTERHTYPKGLLLITVRKSYGKPPAKIVSEMKRYISYQDFLADSAQQSSVTELYGLSIDTLVTHVNRNGTIETYTFRLPIITRVTNPVDGSARVTTRYAVAGAVRSEVRDGSGKLVQFRETYGDSTGALTTYTQYADASWRNVRTIGQADGSVYHEITSGP